MEWSGKQLKKYLWSCERKKAYTEWESRRFVWKMKSRGHQTFNRYLCKFCGHWHVGNKQVSLAGGRESGKPTLKREAGNNEASKDAPSHKSPAKARAVAPVETPDGQVSWADTWPGYESCKCGHYHCDHGGPEDSCGVLGCKCGTFVSSSAKVGNSPQSEQNKAISQSKIPPLRNEPLPFTSEVQTRLTAEQFYDSQDKFNFFPDESRGISAIWAFAEAFRYKSEAQSQQFAAQLESNITFLNERVAEQKGSVLNLR